MDNKAIKFRLFYSKTLKFFKLLPDFKQNKVEILEYVKILNKNLIRILSSIKEEIIQKNIDLRAKKLGSDKYFKDERKKREIFFRVKIYKKLQENLMFYVQLLKEKSIKREVLNSLPSFLKNFDFQIKELFSLLYRYYEKEYLSDDQITPLLNILFDRNPANMIKLCVNVLKEENRGILNKRKVKTKLFYQNLVDNVDIYPELYREKLNFFIRDLKQNYITKNVNWIYDEQIVYYIAKNFPETFKSEFFKIINLYVQKIKNKIKSKDNYLELAIEYIYSNNSFKLFNYFHDRLNMGLRYFFKILKYNDKFLTDFILRFFVDLIHHIRIFINNGKYDQNLFLIIINLLTVLKEQKIYDEYFLIAIQSELKIGNKRLIDNLATQKELNQKDLANNYNKLIEILQDYLDIIFQS